MANLTRVRTPGGWTGGSSITTTELTKLDANQMAAIDAVMGGCWAPTSPVIFNGTGSITITGPVKVFGATGRLTTKIGSGAVFALEANDFYKYGPGHAGATVPVAESLASASCGLPAIRTSSYAQPAASTVQDPTTGAPTGVTLAKELRGYDGGTLSTLTLTFQPSYPHAAIPTTMPRARVVRFGLTDALPTPLTSVAAGADANGWVTFPTPSTGTWGPSLGVQTLAITCDQNNVVDISQYRYLLEVQDEVASTSDSAPVPATTMAPCRLATTLADLTGGTTVLNNIPITIAGDSGALDGVPIAATDRILVTVGGTSPNGSGLTRGMNGIWSVTAGSVVPWTRTGWLVPNANAYAVPPVGTLVYVFEGTDSAGSFMQIATSTPTTPGWVVDVATVGANITTTGTYVLDGVALIVGMKVLVKDQTGASGNDIYTVAAGSWTPNGAGLGSLYWSGVTGITNPGGDVGLVSVRNGAQNGGTSWRTNGPSKNTATRDTGVDVTFAPWTPTGSQFFAALPTYTNISDMRWP